jgi:16S rRNA (guanine527-N7)-methyltransferase
MRGPGAVSAVCDVSRETLERFSTHLALLERWNAHINLVSTTTLPDAWRRHIADSAQLWQLAPRLPKHWLDLGSGAGFPGLVIAAIAAEKSPATHVTLVESDQRKAAFLRSVATESNLIVSISADRIESLSEQEADVVSARALAPLPRLLEMAEKHLKLGGICLFLKGETVHSEVAEAGRLWRINPRIHPSLTDPRAAIVEIGAIDRA